VKREKLVIGIILTVCLISIAMGAYLIIQASKVPAEQRVSLFRILEKEGIAKEGIAVIHIYGPISIDYRGLLWAPGGADAIVKRLKEIREDSRVKGVLLRINSPGGSVAAVQEIYEEVNKLREEGKKVVASLGDIATSGGYYIACAADKIVTNPGTLTGSIGVIMKLGNMEELFKKIGLRTIVIKSGEHKDIGSPTRAMTPKERELLQGIIDNAYEQFLKAVKEGREMKEARIRELAQGQLFTGEQALNEGLVDQLGNYQDSLELTAELSGIEGEPVIIRKHEPWQRVIDILSSKLPKNPLEELLPERKVRFEYTWEG
jgi:protease-4